MNMQLAITALPRLGRAADFEVVFEQTPIPLLLVEIRPAGLFIAAANSALRAALGLTGVALPDRDLDSLFLTEAAMVLTNAIRRAATGGEPIRLTLDSLRSVSGWRHDLTLTAVDTSGPSGFVLVSVEPHPPRPARASPVMLGQLEALGEGQIVVFDLVRNKGAVPHHRRNSPRCSAMTWAVPST